MPQPPHRWTPEEDKLLEREVLLTCVLNEIATDGVVKDWQRIASMLPGRTNRDCRKRWNNVVSGGMNKGYWTPVEDKMLSEAVQLHGQNWTAIASMVKTRKPDQCSKRWNQVLDPKLDRSQWGEEENKRLLEAYAKKGPQWQEIRTEYFPTRSRNAIKNQYTILSRKQKRAASKIQPESETHLTKEETANGLGPEEDGTDSSSDAEGNDSDMMMDISVDISGSLDQQDYIEDSSLSTWDSYVNSTNGCHTRSSREVGPILDIGTAQDTSEYMFLENKSSGMHSTSANEIGMYDFLNLGDSGMEGLPDLMHEATALSRNDNQYPDKITLTLFRPTAGTVESLMRVALGSKSKFSFERD